MRADDLPIDVWRVILRHLRNPVPPPLSRPARSALRQPHLTVCARVCKMFFEICKPLLYKTVVTDDLPSFLDNFTSPMRRKLLGYTEYLYIEYCDKTFAATYMDLMDGDEEAWYGLTMTEEDRREAALGSCEMELQRFLLCLEPFVKRHTRVILPRLTQVAVSSIYGGQDEVWSTYDDEQHEAYGESMLDYGITFWRSFLSTSNIKQWCFRSCCGPLSLSPISGPCSRKGADNATMTTVHFGEIVQMLYIAPGKKVRWVSDVTSMYPWRDLFPLVSGNIQTLIAARSTDAACAKYEPVDVNMYFSTAVLGRTTDDTFSRDLIKTAGKFGHKPNQGLTLAQQRAVAEHYGQFWQKRFRDSSGKDDSFRWYASADSPICEACGSGSPC